MKPKFKDHVSGLGITVDGVNYMVVYLTKFTVHPGGIYTAEVQVRMYDSFGLDKSDIDGLDKNEEKGIWDRGVQNMKNTPKRLARAFFVAWWTLQHFFGYKPLRTVIIINEKISGFIK
jgi:hypothetical protein